MTVMRFPIPDLRGGWRALLIVAALTSLFLELPTWRYIGRREDGLYAIEFGLAAGAGLMKMARMRPKSRGYRVEVEVVGFDTIVGLPPPADYRDHPEFGGQATIRPSTGIGYPVVCRTTAGSFMATWLRPSVTSWTPWMV